MFSENIRGAQWSKLLRFASERQVSVWLDPEPARPGKERCSDLELNVANVTKRPLNNEDKHFILKIACSCYIINTWMKKKRIHHFFEALRLWEMVKVMKGSESKGLTMNVAIFSKHNKEWFRSLKDGRMRPWRPFRSSFFLNEALPFCPSPLGRGKMAELRKENNFLQRKHAVFFWYSSDLC